MNQPLISVIIPAHNAETTIAEAIDSILNQTYPNLEIIVIDDWSTDKTREIVMGYQTREKRVRYFELPFKDPKRVNRRGRNVNAGYSARNYGFEKAGGEWITFQDSDDASLRNRIEAQYILAQRYGADHLCFEWQRFLPERISASFDFERALAENPGIVIKSDEIAGLASRAKGVAMRFLGKWHRCIPFEIKTARFINRLFFGSLESYPASGNSPLFKREILEKVRFRPMDERVWPSFTGRGADRDFNFQVAETFGKSFCFKLPMYLWRVERENSLGYDFDKYLIK